MLRTYKSYVESMLRKLAKKWRLNLYGAFGRYEFGGVWIFKNKDERNVLTIQYDFAREFFEVVISRGNVETTRRIPYGDERSEIEFFEYVDNKLREETRKYDS